VASLVSFSTRPGQRPLQVHGGGGVEARPPGLDGGWRDHPQREECGRCHRGGQQRRLFGPLFRVRHLYHCAGQPHGAVVAMVRRCDPEHSPGPSAHCQHPPPGRGLQLGCDHRCSIGPRPADRGPGAGGQTEQNRTRGRAPGSTDRGTLRGPRRLRGTRPLPAGAVGSVERLGTADDDRRCLLLLPEVPHAGAIPGTPLRLRADGATHGEPDAGPLHHGDLCARHGGRPSPAGVRYDPFGGLLSISAGPYSPSKRKTTLHSLSVSRRSAPPLCPWGWVSSRTSRASHPG